MKPLIFQLTEFSMRTSHSNSEDSALNGRRQFHLPIIRSLATVSNLS
jgi:hypothetical protein